MSVQRNFRKTTGVDVEIRLPCRVCVGRTKHHVLFEFTERGSEADERFSVEWTTKYQVVQCLGCEDVSFRQEGTNSESYDYDANGSCIPFIEEKLYPPRLEGRRSLGYLMTASTQVRQIYDETLVALSNNAPILSGLGLRALLEAVCRHKEAVGGTLDKKIDDLAEKRVLTEKGAKTLHRVRLFGNTAAHEGTPPQPSDLSDATDVVEHLLREIYVIKDVQPASASVVDFSAAGTAGSVAAAADVSAGTAAAQVGPTETPGA